MRATEERPQGLETGEKQGSYKLQCENLLSGAADGVVQLLCGHLGLQPAELRGRTLLEQKGYGAGWYHVIRLV